MYFQPSGVWYGLSILRDGAIGADAQYVRWRNREQVRIAAYQCAHGRLPGGSNTFKQYCFMGMGEALGNYKAMMAAIRQISALPPEGLGISARNITLSTVGVVPGIRKQLMSIFLYA